MHQNDMTYAELLFFHCISKRPKIILLILNNEVEVRNMKLFPVNLFHTIRIPHEILQLHESMSKCHKSNLICNKEDVQTLSDKLFH